MATRRVDSHHHLWKYSPDEYAWISEGMQRIRRDFLVDDLKRAAREVEIDHVISVQARQSEGETAWLLDLASSAELIRGVVGWLPLTDVNVGPQLEKFANHRKLRGVRHILHDEPDDFYMLRGDFNRGVELLKDFGLRYDILIREHHLPQTIEFVDRHPNQVFILDHIAKPRIREQILAPWSECIQELAKREHVYCKLSGMVAEADWKRWTAADLQPYFDVVIKTFGPRRLMFGSDWPVSLLGCSYKKWFETVLGAIHTLSAFEQQRILGETAIEAYGL